MFEARNPEEEMDDYKVGLQRLRSNQLVLTAFLIQK
jgi:hypothetical protein